MTRRSLLALLGASIRKEKDRKRAPDFELKDASGNTVKLSDFAGKVVLINFWATWCVPCKVEIPWIIDLTTKYKDQGFAAIGISMDEGGWPIVNPYVAQSKIQYRIVLGNPRVAYLYGDVDALPVTFLVDRQGRVAAIHLGTASKKQFEADIVKLLEAGRKG